MVPDVVTSDYTKMFCLNCARKIVSPKPTTKYGAITNYLKFRAAFTDTVKLSFAELDGIIGENLPISAYRDQRWWNNSPNSAHAKAWLNAGWKTLEINLREGYVVFHKEKNVLLKKIIKRKISRYQDKKPFTPVPAHVPKPRKPSKTKIAKLHARLNNLERQRTSMPKYVGNFKPKPRHEKRLFKSDKKPLK